MTRVAASRRGVSWLLWVVAATAVGLVVSLAHLGGTPRALVTRGTSMQPTLDAGDLVVLAPASGCTLGAVSAYRKASEVVLHRVTGQEDGRCVLQGDGNSWVDPDRPLPSELLGTLVLRVPGGGVWWHRLTSPTLLGIVAFALIAFTGTSTAARRSRRGRRQTGRPLPRPLSLL